MNSMLGCKYFLSSVTLHNHFKMRGLHDVANLAERMSFPYVPLERIRAVAFDGANHYAFRLEAIIEKETIAMIKFAINRWSFRDVLIAL